MTVIEIKPHRWGWKIFEAPGVEPVFPLLLTHRDDGKRIVVRADKKLTAFLELEKVTSESFRFLNAE
jgi:hypothetical protein